MSHSPEPWQCLPYTGPVPAFRMHSATSSDGKTFIVAIGGESEAQAMANLSRVIACVNILRGIPTADLQLLYDHPMDHCNAIDDIRCAIDGAKARPAHPHASQRQ